MISLFVTAVKTAKLLSDYLSSHQQCTHEHKHLLHFMEGEDFFFLKPEDARNDETVVSIFITLLMILTQLHLFPSENEMLAQIIQKAVSRSVTHAPFFLPPFATSTLHSFSILLFTANFYFVKTARRHLAGRQFVSDEKGGQSRL